MAEFLLEYIEKEGYESKLENGNLIVNPGPQFFVATHMDTIRRNMEFRVEDEIIYGRGANDPKGSIASILIFLDKVKNLNLSIVFLKDEEEGGSGSMEFVRRHAGRYAIIMEPTSLRICNHHAGNIEIVFRVEEEETHGSFCGGAIEKTIDMIEELKKLNFWKEGKYFDSCFTVQEINGENQYYLNPGLCTGRIETRILPEQSAEKIADEMIQIIKKYGHAEIKEIWNGYEMRDQWFMEKVKDACRRASIPYITSGMKSWTDAIVFNIAGIKSIVFGPGNLKYAHTQNEHVKIKEIEKAAEFLLAFNEVMG